MSGLERRLDEACFLAAWRHVRRHGGAGVDGVGAERFGLDLANNLARLRQEVLAGSYRPGRLLRLNRPKPDGGSRLLGVPTLADRIAQSAVLRASSHLDRLLRPQVHGYRPGRSPRTAVAHLAQQAGCRPHLEVGKADVEQLFDNLPLSLVRAAAEAAWSDPLWRRLVAAWLTAWPTAPQRGVPQGAPLSPLLANLALNAALDRELASPSPPLRRAELAGWIRYGDDVVLACGRRGGGALALSYLDGVLRRCGLALSHRKTTFCAGPLPLRFPVLGAQLGFRRCAGGWQLHAIGGFP